MKTVNNRDGSDLSDPNTTINGLNAVQPVRIINDWKDDYGRDMVRGRNSGFTAGYSSSVNLTYSSCMPGIANGGFVTLPAATTTGATPILVASSSTQDSATGSGIWGMLLFYMNDQREVLTSLVLLNGITPVTVPITNVYHFMYGFPVSAGSGQLSLPPGQVTSNVGTIWVGSGAFTGATGFQINYMWNRPGDGFVTSGVYVVPKGKLGQLSTVKYNSDTTVSCQFVVYGRSDRQSPWSLNAEDTINTTYVIERSFTGGYLPPGFELTVLVRKTANTGNISANFVMTVNEMVSYLFNRG
jgi:hypothetical protein